MGVPSTLASVTVVASGVSRMAEAHQSLAGEPHDAHGALVGVGDGRGLGSARRAGLLVCAGAALAAKQSSEE